MSVNLEKDELYYSDLLYVVRKYAGMQDERDAVTEKRIAERCHSVDVLENGVRSSHFSEFQLEVFTSLEGIIAESRKVQTRFMLPPNYQEIVMNTLNSIEEKKINVKKR